MATCSISEYDLVLIIPDRDYIAMVVLLQSTTPFSPSSLQLLFAVVVRAGHELSHMSIGAQRADERSRDYAPEYRGAGTTTDTGQ